MKTNKRMFLAKLAMLFLVVGLSGCATNQILMENVNTGVKPAIENIAPASSDNIDLSSKSMLVLPDRSLGLEPTPAIRRGDISPYKMLFSKRLYAGEWFPGSLRHDTWTINDADGSEHFGQIIFSGMHASGYYFGTNVIDGQVSSGITAVLSFAMDFIYSPLGKELPIERERFQDDPVYRREKITEVNTKKNGKVFNISYLGRVDDFKWYLKKWNQLKTPDGYILTPYGLDEVAKIRGINPQYSYLQKLVGTGKFAVVPSLDPTSLAIANSIGILMDMINAKDAPSRGWDFGSQVSRRQNSFVVEYALTLAEQEIQKRDKSNAEFAIKSGELTKQ